MIRERVIAGLVRAKEQGKKLGRAKIADEVEAAIRAHLSAGTGIIKTAKLVGVGNGTVARVKAEMALRTG